LPRGSRPGPRRIEAGERGQWRRKQRASPHSPGVLALPIPLPRVLVVGGYGAFGGHVARRLAREAGLELIIAGRSLERAQQFAASLAGAGSARITALQMDATSAEGQQLAAQHACVVINASGPYQAQDYRLARACIAAAAHYIDLADARSFVAGIGALNQDARRAGVLVVSGASTVPALSSAVVDAYATQFATLEAVSIVISPGNSFDPGLATAQSVLRSLGRPFLTRHAGLSATAYGWQGLKRRALPGLGGRWLGVCDVPDLDLLPGRHAGLKSVRVYAALEVGAFHLALWGLSWLVRAGLVANPERLARPLLAMKQALRFLGSNVGGMTVTLEGRDRDNTPRRVDWRLIARGDGPYVPATPSVVLAKGLLAGRLAARGAMPCVGLLALNDVLEEFADLDISTALA